MVIGSEVDWAPHKVGIRLPALAAVGDGVSNGDFREGAKPGEPSSIVMSLTIRQHPR